MKDIFLCVGILISVATQAQLKPQEKDSLWDVWSNETNVDSIRFSALYIFSQKGYLGIIPDSAYYFGTLHYSEAEKKGNIKEKGLAQLTRGISWAIRGQYDSCKFYFKDALNLHESIDYESGIMRASFNLGNLSRMSGDTITALEYYDRSYIATKVLNDTMGIIKNLAIQGKVLMEKGDIDLAYDKYSTCIELARTIKNHSEHASLLIERANVSKRRVNYHFSIIDYESAIKTSKKHGLITSEANALTQMASLLHIMNELEKAENLSKIALELADSTQNVELIFNALGAYNSIKGNKLSNTEKEIIINRMISTSDQMRVVNKQINARIEYLGYLYDQEKYDELIYVSNEVDSLLSTTSVRDIYASYYSYLGKAYLKKNNLMKAESYALKGLEISENSNNINSQKNASYLMYRVKYAQNEEREALKYLEKAYDFNRKIYNDENERAILNASFSYGYETKNLADSLAFSYKEKVLVTENQAQRKISILALGGLLVFAVLSIFLFRSRRTIATQKAEISKSLEEKDTLLREIHHRVKNNLQVVSSLLRLQTRSTSDEQAKGALNESQTRVESMSLIHQNLYQKENLTGIKMKDYLEKLTSNLFSTYKINTDQVRLKLDIEDLNLDVETVVPLGLIINELVANSLKYAFPEERAGLIEVSLKEQNKCLELKIADNGAGMDDVQKLTSGSSFGYKLIKSFNKKIKAELNINSSLNNGTEVLLVIKNYKEI